MIGNKGKVIYALIFTTKSKTKHKEEVKPKCVSKMDRYETRNLRMKGISILNLMTMMNCLMRILKKI